MDTLEQLSSFQPGHQITVKVDSVFEDGMVVTHIGKDGKEYRGALLGPPSHKQRQPSLICQNVDLANPLSYLHDHPYPKLKRYAMHLARKIPPEVLLEWNTVPTSMASLNGDFNNLQYIADRRVRDCTINPRNVGKGQNNVAIVPPAPSGNGKQLQYNWPYVLNNYSDSKKCRQSKLIAQQKVKADIESMNQTTKMYLKAMEIDRSADTTRQQLFGSRKRRATSQSPIEGTKKKRSNDSAHDSGMSSDFELSCKKSQSLPSSPHSRLSISLKDFSIPLSKIPTKEKNHQYTGTDIEYIIVD